MNKVNAQRKLILGVVLVSAIAVTGLQSATAGPWGGSPCGECDGYGFQRQELLDDKSIAAREAFLAETTELRKEMATKKAEKRAIMLNDNPDAQRVAKLTGEIFDIREKLQSMAKEKGIEKNYYGRGSGYGCNGPGPRGYQR